MGPMRFGQRSAGLTATTFLVVIAVALITVVVFLGRGKIFTAIDLVQSEGPAAIYYRAKDKLPWTWPNISWPTASPQSQGLDSAELDELRDALAAKDTKALLIARNGYLVYEYYSSDWDPNRRHSIAAMGKGVTASMILLRALTIGAISLDDPLSNYIPEWLDDSVRSRITVRQIGSHSSGMEDVNFLEGQAGWKLEYLDNPDRRFRMAIDTVPIMYEPGERYSYSGVAFHVLAYALARALEPHSVSDMRQWLKQEVMQPLDIPSHDWQISYSNAYPVDGMPLYSLGSGGAYTARAVGRIGQLLLERGQWDGQRLFDPQWVDAMLRYAGSPPDRQTNTGEPAAGIGVWVNCDRFWPSLPIDGVVAAGASHQLLAVIPSFDMVVVRFGAPLGADQWEGDFWEVLDGALFAPLTNAVLDAPLNSLTQSCSGRVR
jgi:CubicO group peptidase (beta-lactamase class C family)